MQSISGPSSYIHPLDTPVDTTTTEDGSYEVLQLEKLLNKVFGDQLDKALAVEHEGQALSNLIEFPLIQELVFLQDATAQASDTLDFSPEVFAKDDPVLETDLTRFTPSIIERDDSDFGHLQTVVDAQQEQLAHLRGELRLKDIVIRSQAVDLASKDDQLKYIPELFDKALRLAEVEANNLILTKDLAVERLVNEEVNCELGKAKSELAQVNSLLLVKFARALGLLS
jgi:hypothetical protein